MIIRDTGSRAPIEVMMIRLLVAIATSVLVPSLAIAQNTQPTVVVTSVHQLPGTSLVTVGFDVEDLDGDLVDIRLYYSDDGGLSWNGPCATVWGDVGIGQEPRTGMIATWDAGVDLPSVNVLDFRMRVYADDRSGVPEGFVYVGTGTFLMGSPPDEPGRNHGETQHTVTLTRGFYMSKYEVTEQWWAEVMGISPTASLLPKVNVNWDEAVEFCNVLSLREGLTPAYTVHGPEGNVTWDRDANGYRLPTEAEWEYACRAGTTTAFNNGTNCLSSETQANFDGRLTLGTCPRGPYRGSLVIVGSFPPNGWGLFDMHGNAWEWIWDGYSDYASMPDTDPAYDPGPLYARGLRGGGFGMPDGICRSAERSDRYPSLTGGDMGFRLVRWAP
jgi:formylglycine-generating enzyme required for sulfatase activity